MGYKGKEKNVYSSFNINIRKVLFEHPECFDLRYVYHRYKQTAEGRYWWHSRDDKRQLYKMSNGYLVSPYNT